MTSALAAIRADSWNFPLLLHVAGAAVLFGAVLTAVATTLTADRTAHPDHLRRLAFRSLLFVGLPAYILMRAGAEWIYSKEFGDTDEDDPAWVGIGYMVSDVGLLVFLIALALAWFASRRRHSGLARASGLLGALLLVGLLVAVWAMGAKPD
jgi:hypothetical protein